MKSKKLLAAVCAAGFGLALAAGPASALTWFTPVTAFEDDNLDFVFDNDNNDEISVGDRFVSVLKFTDTLGIVSGQDKVAIAPNELTGVADVTIIAIGPGGEYVFGPSGAAGVLAGYNAGTMIAAFLDPANDLVVDNASCGTRAQCITKATNGNLFLTAGFFGDPDELWVANAQGGGGNISTVEGGNATSKFGEVNFSLTIDVNNTTWLFGPQNCAPFCNPIPAAGQDGKVQLIGSADILGGQELDHDEWTARSDTDAQLAPFRVPEPGSLALLGMALAGLGVVRRRK